MSLPAWWTEKALLKRQNARSRKQEQKFAKDTGGRVQRGSGSSYRAPGDVKDDHWLTELKYTDARSFSITRAVWRIHRNRARTMGREPRMVIDFMTNGRVETRLVITEEKALGPPRDSSDAADFPSQ